MNPIQSAKDGEGREKTTKQGAHPTHTGSTPYAPSSSSSTQLATFLASVSSLRLLAHFNFFLIFVLNFIKILII